MQKYNAAHPKGEMGSECRIMFREPGGILPMVRMCTGWSDSEQSTVYSALALKSNSDLAELGGKGYVKFDLCAREFDLCAR